MKRETVQSYLKAREFFFGAQYTRVIISVNQYVFRIINRTSRFRFKPAVHWPQKIPGIHLSQGRNFTNFDLCRKASHDLFLSKSSPLYKMHRVAQRFSGCYKKNSKLLQSRKKKRTLTTSCSGDRIAPAHTVVVFKASCLSLDQLAHIIRTSGSTNTTTIYVPQKYDVS